MPRVRFPSVTPIAAFAAHNLNMNVFDRPLLLSGIVGSVAYGFATAASDEDRSGVFAFTAEELLGFDRPRESFATTAPDSIAHEVRKFLSLAFKANPTATDLLWLPEYEQQTDDGRELVAMRRSLLSTDAVRSAYAGFAHEQHRRYIAYQRTETETYVWGARSKRAAKTVRHMFRALEHGTALISTGELELCVKDRGWYLFDLNNMADDDIERLYAERLEALRNVPSVLREQPDRAAITAWLVDFRRRTIAG
jgi:predicted nucleotidyltransferase